MPATDDLVAELVRYRRAHGLAPTQQSGDGRPLVLPAIDRANHGKVLSRVALHLFINEI
ncbi:hypothetical protein [Cupriavidus numazuensis]|uniref:hypothetical protein n=1 Tax=Cupriavidus numazuensis TaxID=221992 RepID=UPI001BAA2637|nr:hypothetical protein [Cupriavidus numazuensis]